MKNYKRLLSYIKPYLKRLGLAIFCIVMAAAANLYLPWIIKAIDGIIESPVPAEDNQIQQFILPANCTKFFRQPFHGIRSVIRIFCQNDLIWHSPVLQFRPYPLPQNTPAPRTGLRIYKKIKHLIPRFHELPSEHFYPANSIPADGPLHMQYNCRLSHGSAVL